MELFRRNSKVQKFDFIKGDVIHAYLGFNIIANQEQFLGLVISLTEEIPGKTTESVTVSTDCINRAI
jgi:hypothetical protein